MTEVISIYSTMIFVLAILCAVIGIVCLFIQILRLLEDILHNRFGLSRIFKCLCSLLLFICSLTLMYYFFPGITF